MKKGVTGIVLAGGMSTRMGTDKSLLLLNGKTLICHAITALSPLCDKVVISSNKQTYDFTECEVWPDLLPQQAPMIGIYSCLKRSTTETNIFLSCDMPLITSGILEYLLFHSLNHNITIPVHDLQIEPLCGIYKKNCLPVIEQFIAEKNFKMRDLFALANCQYVKIEDRQINLFQNVNTKEDFDMIGNKW
jgi:molybdenum cofactor guanylyltransferase